LEEAGKEEEGGDVAAREEGKRMTCRLSAFSAAMVIACLPVRRMEGANARDVGVLPGQTIDRNHITVLAGRKRRLIRDGELYVLCTEDLGRH
jgi:hypothetical protein